MKKLLLKIYYFGNLSKPKIEKNQQQIRDIEWQAIADFIPNEAKFLDVGCGAGYAMMKAKEEKRCTVEGVDPEPGAHGVGRYVALNKDVEITQGFSEDLPYLNESFDIVYSSHVLEHVQDESKSLQEMRRVLKKDGTLIIGMPTSNMAWINFLTQMLFTTHHRVVNFLLSPIKAINVGKTKLINVFIPGSHSYPRANTVLYDLGHYRIKNWQKTVAAEFEVVEVVKPAFYPYPEYLQLFNLKEKSRFTSSVFFICKKK